MTVKVAINGFGRIGRNVLRGIMESGRTDIEVVAINDLGPVETNAHLMRYDSVHGKFPGTVQSTVTQLTLDKVQLKSQPFAILKNYLGQMLMLLLNVQVFSQIVKKLLCTWKTVQAAC
jgi:homoserine dehydrogenase